MNSTQIARNVTKKLEKQIESIWDNFDDIQERNITIQLIPRVIQGTKGDLHKALNESANIEDFNTNRRKEMSASDDNTYLFLQKKSSGDIVFPSGSIEKYEIYKEKLNPQGIVLASLREFKEELHEIISIDADNIIDIYPCIPFEANGKKYMQFRLLAYILSQDVVDIEKKFADSLWAIPEHKQEHDHCYLRSYRDAFAAELNNSWKFKHSTLHSLEFHNI